uniref:Uncharacterized protein n=1 Tax=Strigamia maritima TaxID=126957 RepID=T1ILD8_STRMM
MTFGVMFLAMALCSGEDGNLLDLEWICDRDKDSTLNFYEFIWICVVLGGFSCTYFLLATREMPKTTSQQWRRLAYLYNLWNRVYRRKRLLWPYTPLTDKRKQTHIKTDYHIKPIQIDLNILIFCDIKYYVIQANRTHGPVSMNNMVKIIVASGTFLVFLTCATSYPHCTSMMTDSCVCITQKNSISPTCFGVSTGDHLKQKFAHLTDVDAQSIAITNCNQLTSLPSRVFLTVKTKNLIIQKTSLSLIENNAFKGYEFESSLETLNFNENNFEYFNFMSLTNLKQLHGLRITNDNLMELTENAFSHFLLLEYIDLSHNQINHLGKNAFYNLPLIRLIDLRANKLKTIDEHVFNLNDTKHPVTLLLNNNEIANIHKNAFTDLRIENLELENNKLETLRQDVFEPLLDYFDSSPSESGILYVKDVFEPLLDYFDSSPSESGILYVKEILPKSHC